MSATFLDDGFGDAPPPRWARRRDEKQARALARATGYVLDRLRLLEATPRQLAIARVIVTCIDHGRVQPVGSFHLQQRCYDRGVRSRFGNFVGVGTIAEVLDLMRRAGLVRWLKGHVPRWHGKLAPSERPAMYPRRPKKPTRWNPECDPRLPPRRLELLGRARRLAGGGDYDGRDRSESGSENTASSTSRGTCTPVLSSFASARNAEVQAVANNVPRSDGPEGELYDALERLTGQDLRRLREKLRF